MRRYWLEPEDIHSETVDIQGETFHHICGVCRQGMGDRFEVLGQDNIALMVEIIEVRKREAKAKILSKRDVPPLKVPHIILAVSLPKLQTFETILEKAVELGVSTVLPFFSEHSYFRKSNDALVGKQKRWQKIVKMATQQCGRSEIMNVLDPVNLENIIEKFNHSNAAMGLFAFEGHCERNVKQVLTSGNNEALKNIWLFVGSEGGFSRQEVDFFKSSGLEPVTLGEQVLRVETACLALVSIIKYECNLMQ